jgi:hypothetical protein
MRPDRGLKTIRMLCGCGTLVLSALGQGAAAQSPATAAPPAAEPELSPPQSLSGVQAYPPEFFAASQPQTARDMIDRLPGFVFDGGAYVRGFAGAAGNVLIDGARPTSKNDDLDSVLRRIPASAVQRIDVIRGASPGIDMQGKTVMANVIRKTGGGGTGVIMPFGVYIPRDGRFLPGLRLEGTTRVRGNLLEGSFDAEQFFDDGAGTGPELTRASDGALQAYTRDTALGGGDQVTATGAYTTPLLGGKFRVNGQVFGQTYQYSERDTAPPPKGDVYSELDKQARQEGELGLTYDRDLGRRTKLNALIVQQVKAEKFDASSASGANGGAFHENHLGSETISRATVSYSHSRTLSFESGGELDYNWLQTHSAISANGAAGTLPSADIQVDEVRAELFTKGVWVVNPKLTTEAGIRFEGSRIGSHGEVSSSRTLTIPKPRVVAIWSPTPQDQLRLRVEREVTQLDFNDFIAQRSISAGQVFAGNPTLTPQQALVIETAYERKFGKAGDLTLTYRRSELTDAIDRAPIYSPTGTYDAPANIGSGFEDEYITALSAPLGPLVKGGLFKVAVTLRKSGVTDPTTGEIRSLSYLRERQGEIDFTQDLPERKLKWGASLGVGFSRPSYRYNQIQVDDFRPFGWVFVEYQPRRDLQLRVFLQDLGADFQRSLKTYDPDRAKDLTPVTSRRDLYFGSSLYLSVRKTFG